MSQVTGEQSKIAFLRHLREVVMVEVNQLNYEDELVQCIQRQAAASKVEVVQVEVAVCEMTDLSEFADIKARRYGSRDGR